MNPAHPAAVKPFPSTRKIVPAIVGLVLGLLFVMASLTYFFELVPVPPLPEGSPAAHFLAAVGPTGFMNWVKVCELSGGILVAIPRTRNLGLLVLGPVILNIVAYHALVMKGEGLFDPMLIGICLAAAYLLWTARSRFAGLLRLPEPKR
jgi:hypothetical protein